MPNPLYSYQKDGWVLHMLRAGTQKRLVLVTGKDTTFTIPVASLPQSYLMDPNAKLLYEAKVN